MKKWLISLVLCFAPIYVNAASFTLDNPVISQGSVFAVPGLEGQYIFAFDQVATGSVTLTLDAMLTGAVDRVLDLKVTSYLQNWSLSFIDQTQGLSTSLIQNSMLDTHNLRVAMLAGSVYQWVFTGVTPLRHFSIEVSEVPLPAAVWLFGSMLLGGLVIKRRKAKQAQFAI